MKKRNKLVALLLAATMVFSMAACGKEDVKESQKESTKPSEESKVTSESNTQPSEEVKKGVTFPLEEALEFTVFNVMNAGKYKLAESSAMKLALDNANMKFDFVAEVINTEAAEKLNLLIAGGDYPDFLYKPGVGVDVLNQYGADGILIPLEDLIREYAPNCAAKLDETDGWDVITAADGHVYTMPYFTYTSTYAANPMWINQDWLTKVGKEMPKSLDDLYDVMVAFKTQDPNGNGKADEIPMVYSANVFTTNRFLGYMPETLVYYDTYMNITEDGKGLEFFAMSDTYKKDYLEFLKKCYDEGLLYEHCYTEQYQNIRAAGKMETLYGLFQCSSSLTYCPDYTGKDYTTMEPLGSKLGMTGACAAGGAAITDVCENPEVLVAWLDQFYTEEGARLADLGVEGVHYKVQSDGGYTNLNPESDPTGAAKLQGTVSAPMMLPELRDHSSLIGAADPEATEINNYMIEQRNKIYSWDGTILPTITLATEDAENISSYFTDIKAYVANYEAQVVTGEIDLDSTWDGYLKTLKDMNIDEVVAAYDRAYKAAIQ